MKIKKKEDGNSPFWKKKNIHYNTFDKRPLEGQPVRDQYYKTIFAVIELL